jgi:hypothetical protein
MSCSLVVSRPASAECLSLVHSHFSHLFKHREAFLSTMTQTTPNSVSRPVVGYGAVKPNEWLGGSPTSPSASKVATKRSSNHSSEIREAIRNDDWLGGGVLTDSPTYRGYQKGRNDPIKIEGAKSIKDSPFFR